MGSRLCWLVLVSVMAAGSQGLLAEELKYPFAASSLSGAVKSQKGELLEGILVRAKKEKATVARVVVSDAQGKYRFPTLEPGWYVVEIARADGLEPESQKVEIRGGQQSRADFTLGPAKDMEQQMTSVDWLRNLPGTPAQVRMINDECEICHTGTLVRFRFDKENWVKYIRLATGTTLFFNQRGQPRHSQAPGAKPNRELPGWEEKNQALADLMAKFRGPQPMDFSNAKITPRPTGRSTRVMFTEYDAPWHDAELHEVAVDRYGMVWFTDWRWPKIGMLNPETGEIKTWDTPPLEGKSGEKENYPGSQEISFDKDENMWTSICWSGGLLKIDRKTEKITTWTYPDRGSRRLMSAESDPKRNRIWFHTDDYYGTDYAAYYAPDKYELTVFQLPRKPGARNLSYGGVTDSQGNYYLMKIWDSDIDRIDAETGELTRYSVPTPDAWPRRGDVDSQDRIWFSENNVDQVGVLDHKTGKITEYKIDLPVALPYGKPVAQPYGIGVDRNTDMVWVELFQADRVVKLDPKTGGTVHYDLPELHVMARSPRAAPNSTAEHSILWLGTLPKYGNGKIVKIETW